MIYLLALLCYALSFGLIWQRLESSEAGSKNLLLAAAGVGCAAHGFLLWNDVIVSSALNLALANVVSLVCLVSVIAWLLASLGNRVTTLGILVLPVGVLGLIIEYLFIDTRALVPDPPPSLIAHLAIALLAFAILCVATAQAAILYLQEAQLRKRNPMGLFPALPPLETMQSNLLGLIRIGVVLLTINLVTGSFSQLQTTGTLVAFNHHILLSIIAWIAYVALLAGNKIRGWRGKIAARWTMLAFVVLILAYFGTRFVSSVLLS